MPQLLRVVSLTQIRVKPNRRSNVDRNLNLSWPIVRVFFNQTNKTSVHPQNWCRARFFGRLRFNERERVCSTQTGLTTRYIRSETNRSLKDLICCGLNQMRRSLAVRVLEFVLERGAFYSPFATATISYEKPVFPS